MDDLKSQLTDFRFISDELSSLLEKDQGLLLSIMETHKHGESIDLAENTAKAVIDRVCEMRDSDTDKKLIETTLALESLSHVIPVLLAENNKRLLKLFQELCS